MAHLEVLLAQYLDWKAKLVNRNVKVRVRGKCVWEDELDVVADDPHAKRTDHYELSLDA
jgi:hypothetical protein